MLEKFNLFVSVAMDFEPFACDSLETLLHALGDEAPVVDTAYGGGLLVAQTTLDPFAVITHIRQLIWAGTFPYAYLLKIRPIMATLHLDLSQLRALCHALAETHIRPDESFRVTLERRFTKLPRDHIIEAAAADINRTVDLEHPDKVVYLTVLADLCGVSVLTSEDTVSIAKEREAAEFQAFREHLKKLSRNSNSSGQNPT